MDVSQENLQEVVEEQKKIIEKYSNKLRDIVSAHKSVLQEKKALEDTIKVLNETKNSAFKEEEFVAVKNEDFNNLTVKSKCDSVDELKSQIASLMASFSTLVVEKSNMEEFFKGNQKQLLDEKEAMENKCKDLQEEIKILNKHLKSAENKNLKELHVLKKEMKICNKNLKPEQDIKTRSLENELLTLQVKNYEKELKNLKGELDTKKKVNELCENKLKASSFEVFKLQEQVKMLQIEHQAALQKEKENSKYLKDHTKKLTASQEERVVNLETRLAELSETIGSYERLRVQDQAEIQKLKDYIAFVNLKDKGFSTELKKTQSPLDDYDGTIAQILNLKKHLQTLAVKLKKEEDFKNLFPESSNIEVSHSSCMEEYNKMKAEFELFKQEVKSFNSQSNSGKEVTTLQNLIKNLQEKIRILSENNIDLEKEYQIQIDQLKKSMKNEKAKFKDSLATAESDFQRKTWMLEAQLQKQRERSLALLEEKEQQIHSLQSTFQMFLPAYVSKCENNLTDEAEVLQNKYDFDGPHMVHYANELARKSLEISNLRKSRHQTEMTLRDLQKEMVSLTEKQKYENQFLLDEISRLKRCQLREGANLEYLKNVVFNFLLSNDPKSKRHMFNAIAAVLQFSQSEIQKVIEHNKNKFWAGTNYST